MNPQVDWATVQVKGSFQNRLLRWICERACATDPNNIITLAAYTPNPKAFTTSCTVYHEFTSRPLVVQVESTDRFCCQVLLLRILSMVLNQKKSSRIRQGPEASRLRQSVQQVFFQVSRAWQ